MTPLPGEGAARDDAPRRLEDLDWDTWAARDIATLCFVVRALPVDRGGGEEVLLIRKKRGLGRGKINGPGGRLEGDETPLDCAVRETREELGIVPTGLEERGRLRFQFLDDYSLDARVFVARSFEGTPIETDEAIPLWTPIHAIPYDQMWADDHLWLPHVLAGRSIDGRFLFDGDAMVAHSVVVEGA